MDELKQFMLNKQLKTALAIVGYRDSDVGEVGEDKIYTNEEIKQNFIKLISEQDTFKPILETIIRLINIDVIVPAYVKSGLINKIIYFFFKDKRKFAQSNFCMAFYNFEDAKIYVLVENINNIKYWKKSEAISLITLHEFQHMTSTFFPSSFMKIHAKSLISYYKSFFKLYFNVDISDKEIYKIVNWIHFKTESTKGRSTLGSKTVQDYFKLMWNMLKPFYKNTDDLKKDLFRYFNIMILYLKSPSLYAQYVHSKEPNTFKLYLSLKESYKSLKILQKIDSLCIQEILFPGEVICIESEYNTQPRHFKLITQVKT